MELRASYPGLFKVNRHALEEFNMFQDVMCASIDTNTCVTTRQSLPATRAIPLVVSTTFGLMASTVMVLLVIPCMYMTLGDLGLVEKMDIDQ